eukprot:Rmarinus@m.29619
MMSHPPHTSSILRVSTILPQSLACKSLRTTPLLLLFQRPQARQCLRRSRLRTPPRKPLWRRGTRKAATWTPCCSGSFSVLSAALLFWWRCSHTSAARELRLASTGTTSTTTGKLLPRRRLW